MEAKELRLGNYVNLTKNNFKTVDICKLDVLNIYKIIKNKYLDVKAIPLTEEWLINFGFKKSFFSDSYFKDEFFLNKDYNGKWTFNLLEGIGICLKDIKYIHQLQNLYFELTNKELTTK